MSYTGKDDRRSDVRYGVFERCGITLDGRHFEGLIVDISLGGAALRADVQMATQPSAGTPVTLDIDRVGRVSAKVARPLFNGIAVEFDIDDLGIHIDLQALAHRRDVFELHRHGYLAAGRVVVIVVTPHEKERTALWAGRLRVPFVFVSDPSGRAQAAYGVARQLVFGSEWLPSPGWFVIDRQGRLVWSYVGTKTDDHAHLGKLLPVLADVTAGIMPPPPPNRPR